VASLAIGTPLSVVLHHTDSTTEVIEVQHTYSAQQIEWFKAGSALNAMSLQKK
jgi:aconitate hydratase